MSFNLDICVIPESLTLRDVLKKIDDNKYGFVFIVDDSKKVIGLVTDGDIRRSLLENITLDTEVSFIANKDFIWASSNASRESLMKNLDSKIRFLPILNENKQLVKIVSNDYLPLVDEANVFIRSRAPVRVSFGGGGSDLTHFFKDTSGAVINSAISVYSHALMKVRNDSRVVIQSRDLQDTLFGENLDDALNKKGSFGLIQSILHVIKPTFGFELYLHSDFSVGSGLGGSATLSAAVIGCFNEVRKDKWNQYEISEIAFQAERLHLGIAGGWQDQYASVFGGFNFIEFNAEENIVNPIRVHKDVALELEESLVLCDTGISHNSGNIHENQKQTMSSKIVNEMVRENVKLTHKIRKYLLRGDLLNLGKCLDLGWRNKKNFSKMISNNEIDDIYEGAINSGAVGGKLLGAGGGGYFLFYAPPYKKYELLDYIKECNLNVTPFKFEPEGLQTWVGREQ